MSAIKILWVDDEIDLLKAQVMFLQDKGYDVEIATNGVDAIEKCRKEDYDLVFLDEHMPGLSGLETLSRIKTESPTLPVVMITKSEEENIMDEAIGGQIEDYLIKPVKPKQVLLSIKKIIDNQRLIREKTSLAYQQEFRQIFMALQEQQDYKGWADIYRKLVYWELNLERSESEQMKEVFLQQKAEANREFFKFIQGHYLDWINGREEVPVMSHTLLKNYVLPGIGKQKPTLFLLIDNLRFDQWKVIEPLLNHYYRVEKEELFYSILPTCTQYSRNAIFAGMLPARIRQEYPGYWIDDESEEGKNQKEEELLLNLLARMRVDARTRYTKITTWEGGSDLENEMHNMLSSDLSVVIYNFVDLMSHARTEKGILRELAGNEAAYRSITLSWFKHSPLWAGLKKLAEKKIRLIITTDHGTIRVQSPSKVIGDRNTTSNLRYKTGKNLQYDPKDVFAVKHPEEAGLPKQHVSSSFIFAREDKYFVYPNNYNYYVNYYRNTFQHGGISLEEMLIPYIELSPR